MTERQQNDGPLTDESSKEPAEAPPRRAQKRTPSLLRSTSGTYRTRSHALLMGTGKDAVNVRMARDIDRAIGDALAASNPAESRRALREVRQDTNPDSAFWRGDIETNELWNWDVAEVFIGSDFKNIRRYKEFEVSPQAEWVDLDINLVPRATKTAGRGTRAFRPPPASTAPPGAGTHSCASPTPRWMPARLPPATFCASISSSPRARGRITKGSHGRPPAALPSTCRRRSDRSS